MMLFASFEQPRGLVAWPGAIPLRPQAVSEFRFIPPCRPIPAMAVPAGDGWLHEAKFDGYRTQLQKIGPNVAIFSKHGHRLTMRFQTIADLLLALPAKSMIIDAEIVANNRAGFPDFFSLHTRSADPGAMNVWALDLLMLNGRDLREQPLEKRKARLEALVERLDCPGVLMSQPSPTARCCSGQPRSTASRA